MNRLIIALGLRFIIAGCASNKPLTAIDNLERYQQQLAAVDRWKLRGRLNVRVPEDSDTVTVTWENSGEDYNIQFRGPIGIGSARIVGDPKQVLLQQGGKEPVVARNAEELLYTQLGREVPNSDLYYWVRGLGAPRPRASQVESNEAGNLAFLEQSGWSISYTDYVAVDRWNMPRKIIAKRDDFTITLYSLRWELGSKL